MIYHFPFLLCRTSTKKRKHVLRHLSFEKDDDFLSSPPSPLALHNSLTHSDYLFFIRYIPENTLKATWFLVQINHAETTFLNINSKTIGDYHVTFMSRHPDYVKLCDDKARWWLLWYEYTNNSDNVPVYGSRILLGPKHKPDPSKYILWTDYIHLTDTSCYLHEPFNFESHSDIISVKQHVALTHWEYLLTICNKLSVVSPILSTLTQAKVAHKKRKKGT